MTTPLRELLAYFDISVDPENKLGEADKKVEGFIGKLKTFGKVVVEAFAIEKLREFFGEQIEGAARLQNLSDRLGIAVSELRDFQFAAKSAGIDSEAAAHALGFLNRAIGGAVTGNKKAAEAFAKLGVHVKEGTNVRELADVLPDVADAFEKLKSQPEKAAFAIKLFGRQGMALIPLLAQGRARLEELRKEAQELGSGLSDQFPKDAKKAEEEIFKFHFALGSLKNRITAEALPTITKLFELFKRGIVAVIDFTKHTNVLRTGMAFLAAVATGKLVVSLIAVAKSMGLIKTGILETVAAFAKFAGPTAILYGLYLVLDDIYTWATGGSSVIGEALEQFEGADAAKGLLTDLKGTVDEMMGSVRLIAPEFKNIRQAAAATFPYIGESVGGLIKLFLAFVHTLGAVAEAVGNLTSFMSPDVAKSLGVKGEWKKLVDDWVNRGHQIEQDLGLEQRPGATEPAPPGPAVREGGTGTRLPDLSIPALKRVHEAITPLAREGGSGTRAPEVAVAPAGNVAVSQTNHIDVTVQGGDNPKETGQAVGQGAMTEAQKMWLRALSGVNGQ